MVTESTVEDRRPHVVIIGGGFAGLYAARTLRRAPVRVTLVDRRNHHLFQPLLYQVATASLSPAEIAAPIRSVFARDENIEVLLGEAVAVDAGRRVVELTDGSLSYDYLVVATGATHSYFGHPEWAAHAPGLKSVEDAVEIRRRFLLAFEAAEREDDEATRRALLTFVVVGGGPTGVEMAGAMVETARRGLPRDFRHIDTKTARIVLVQGGPRLLESMPESLSARAKRDLEALGVEVRLGARVTGVDGEGVMIGGERVAAENVIWAAGVQASALGASLGAPVGRDGRVIVGPDLTIPGHPEVFVAGDLAFVKDVRTGGSVPGVAPAAMQMARYAAGCIAREARGGGTGARAPFEYRDKGTLATIGRARAVAWVGDLKFGGFLAWATWAVVHIGYLIGFRSKVLVMLQWAWAYLAYQGGARLITGSAALELRRPRRVAVIAGASAGEPAVDGAVAGV